MPPEKNNMSFESDNASEFVRTTPLSSSTDITGKLVSWGVVKNRRQAEYLEIAIALAAVGLAAVVYF